MIRYPSIDEFLMVHNMVILNFGGSDSEILNFSNLQSTMDQIKYPPYGMNQDIFMKSAILLRGINCGHVFMDGNKRTAYQATDSFLWFNGYEFSPYTDDAEHFMVSMAIDCSKYLIKRIRGWIIRNTRKL